MCKAKKHEKARWVDFSKSRIVWMSEYRVLKKGFLLPTFYSLFSVIFIKKKSPISEALFGICFILLYKH
ncbi:MAG: hypothetical protein C0601_00485 [Candidatus Muiribacterium halophilum]|uniref:Uncharacterized protein n=1 Tax=Muiribacterium halophilum TaxID=2053465 RepID=A0A2N5ZMS7_MUIH1|nr:MAG: hypothetical protein C0601_00485 [Candidatus Muirbacterium halophilum]